MEITGQGKRLPTIRLDVADLSLDVIANLANVLRGQARHERLYRGPLQNPSRLEHLSRFLDRRLAHISAAVRELVTIPREPRYASTWRMWIRLTPNALASCTSPSLRPDGSA